MLKNLIKKTGFLGAFLLTILCSFSCGADGPHHYPWPPYLSTPNHPVYPYPLYPPYPPPYNPPPQLGFCPYGYGSVCRTVSGGSCVQFIENWSPNWFEACTGTGFFYGCVHIPTFPRPFIEQACQPIGSSCICDMGYTGNWYRYEWGRIW